MVPISAAIGIVFVVITFIFGELITPRTAPLAERVRLSAKGSTLASEFRSGMWTKDNVHAEGPNGTRGAVLGSRFFNARQIQPDGKLLDVRVFEFDNSLRMRALLYEQADLGAYGLGRARSLQDYAAFCGIDYPNQRIGAPLGAPVPQPELTA